MKGPLVLLVQLAERRGKALGRA